MIEKCDFWHLAQWMVEQFKDMSEAEIRDADQLFRCSIITATLLNEHFSP